MNLVDDVQLLGKKQRCCLRSVIHTPTLETEPRLDPTSAGDGSTPTASHGLGRLTDVLATAKFKQIGSVSVYILLTTHPQLARILASESKLKSSL
jgi:hypothetical protein